MTWDIESLHHRLQEALEKVAPCQMGTFRTGAKKQIVYDLQNIMLDVWESGRPRIARARYQIQIYQQDFDPTLPMRALTQLTAIGASAMADGEAYTDTSGYTVAGITATLWKEINYNAESSDY